MQAVIILRQIFSLLEKHADVSLEPLALADDANPDAITMQDREVIADEATQEAEQVANFGSGPRPVFRAEGEDGQVANAKFPGSAYDGPQGFDATAMPLGTRQASRGGPPSVSVHNDRHMQRCARLIGASSCWRCGIRHR